MPAPALRPPPIIQMSDLLVRYRALGMGFPDAWARARAGIVWPHDTGHRRQWRLALEATRGEWQACYERQPTKISLLLRDTRPEVTLTPPGIAA